MASLKLFLGGVAPATQKEDLEAHFSQYGTVTDAVVMYKDGRHRGFGFVTFADEESVHSALSEPQIIHDRQIDVKLAVPGGEAPPPRTNGFAGGGGGGFAGGGCGAGGGGGGKCGGGGKSGGKGGGHVGPTDKVFVGGLSPHINEDMLSAYFGRFGTLTDVVVMKDRATGKPRGFGFVRFDSTEPVEQVMAEYETHEFDGKWFEVKKAVPQDQMVQTIGGKPVMNRGWGKGGGGGGFGGGGGGGYGKGGCGGGYGKGGFGGGGGYGKGGGKGDGYALAFRSGNPYTSPAYGGGAYGGGKPVYRSRPY